MLIIPAIDIYKGKVVRLLKGDYKKVTVYNNSPIEQAKEFERYGIKRIHIVDLQGSKEGKFFIEGIIKEIKSGTDLDLQVGGGIRSIEQVHLLNDLEVDYFVIGSVSVINKSLFESIVEKFGAEKVIIASDVMDNKVAVKGWTELTEVTLESHIEYCLSLNVKQFLCTDISRDGLLTGSNVELYKVIKEKYPDVFLIASGGFSSMQELGRLREAKAEAVIIGKAIYEGVIKLEEISKIAE